MAKGKGRSYLRSGFRAAAPHVAAAAARVALAQAGKQLAKRLLGGGTAEPQGNEETRNMVSNAFPIASMYRYKKRKKRFSKRQKRFAKKVKKVLNKRKVMNVYNENYTNSTSVTTSTTTFPDEYFQEVTTNDPLVYTIGYGTQASSNTDCNRPYDIIKQ